MGSAIEQVKKLVVILSSRDTWKKQAWKNKPKSKYWQNGSYSILLDNLSSKIE